MSLSLPGFLCRLLRRRIWLAVAGKEVSSLIFGPGAPFPGAGKTLTSFPGTIRHALQDGCSSYTTVLPGGVREDWEQALVHFGLQKPDGVTDANFYRAATGASDFVSPLTVVQLNPAQSPGPLREICFNWPDFVTNPPNWRMVQVHEARCQSMNQVLHRPTYVVLRRGVDALLALRPHGLLEILGLVPHAINEVFPTVLLILRLLGNLETFCHQFIACRVWVNGDEIDTRMVVVTHGFYILVQLQVTAGADAVIAAEATNAIVRQGRFYHVADSPGLDILHCPGGRTLASCRTMQVTNHFDLPDVNHLREARDQWPDLLGVALRKVHVHHAADVAPAIIRGVLLIVPAVPAFGVVAIGLSLHFDIDTWSSRGGVFTQRFIALTFMLQQLGLQGACAKPATTCECFHNGAVLLDTPHQAYDGDFVSCWILTRTLQPVELQCVAESAEEEPDGDFESNHSVAPSPRPSATKRSADGRLVSKRGVEGKGHSLSLPSLTFIRW